MCFINQESFHSLWVKFFLSISMTIKNAKHIAMFSFEQANTESSKDLRNTDRLSSLFTVRK